MITWRQSPISILLPATRGARNPNLRVVITRASHVCSQHSFGRPLRINQIHRTQLLWSRAFWPSTPRNLITRVSTIFHVKLAQSTALEQKRLDLRSLSPALPILWLLLVYLTYLSRILSISISLSISSCLVLASFRMLPNLSFPYTIFGHGQFSTLLDKTWIPGLSIVMTLSSMLQYHPTLDSSVRDNLPTKRLKPL